MRRSALRLLLTVGAGMLLVVTPGGLARAYGDSAEIVVHVPQDAQVLINGRQTTASGTERQYRSMELVPGRTYSYRITAQAVRNGRLVDETKTVLLSAGSRVTAAFDLAELKATSSPTREPEASQPASAPARQEPPVESKAVSYEKSAVAETAVQSESSEATVPTGILLSASLSAPDQFTLTVPNQARTAKAPPAALALSWSCNAMHLAGLFGTVKCHTHHGGLKIAILIYNGTDTYDNYYLYREFPDTSRMWAVAKHEQLYCDPCCCWWWHCCCCVPMRRVYLSTDGGKNWRFCGCAYSEGKT